MRRLFVILALIAAAHSTARASSPATAAPASSQPEAAIPDVVVTTPSPKRVPQIIEQFGRPFSHDRLSRWRAPACPYVMGMTQDQDDFVANRMVEIAMAAHLPAPTPSCEHNIIIVVAADDLNLRRQMAKHAHQLFVTDRRFSLDHEQLDAFLKDDGAPAHVFYVSSQAPLFAGGPSIDEAPLVGDTADSSGVINNFGAPVVKTTGSRLTPAVDEAFSRVFVVVDGKQLKGVDAGPLAAYLSMITLAEVRVDAPVVSVQSITNLFADRAAGRVPAKDLTLWDRAYLGALYNAPTEINLSFQRSVMAHRIEHSIEVLQMPSSATDEAEGASEPGKTATP